MNEKLDAVGRQLNVGDWVIYSGTWRGINIGQITKMTNKMVFIHYSRQYPHELYLISSSEAKNWNRHLER